MLYAPCYDNEYFPLPSFFISPFSAILLINTRKIAEGPVAEAFTPAALQQTYGGRLATAQIDQISRALG